MKHKKRRGCRPGRKGILHLLTLVPLLLLALLTVSPLLFLVSGSLAGSGELSESLSPIMEGGEAFAGWRLLPRYPTLRHLVEVLFDSPEFFQMFWNSAKLTVGVLAGQLLFATTSAWGLARYRFPGRRQLYLLYIVLMMMPFQVTMLSQYLVLNALGLYDSLWSIILPGAFSTFSVFLMFRFFEGIPESILEAARIDGAGEAAIFLRLGLPLGAPGIFSAMVLQFLECWSMIEQPVTFLKTKSLWPLSLYLPEINLEQAGFALCASLLAVLPALLVFGIGQEYLEQGIMAAAVKE